MPKRLALISVLEKTGIEEFGKFLVDHGYGLLSTGGTREKLVAAGLEVAEVSKYTGLDEMFHGRLKTLHPKIFGGILARMIEEDERQLAELGWDHIDVVVVNLYDFAGAIAKPDVTNDKAVENIDIGGPSLIRAAAKNWRRTLVVPSPADYPYVQLGMDERGDTPLGMRFRQMKKAFALTARYDQVIEEFFRNRDENQ